MSDSDLAAHIGQKLAAYKPSIETIALIRETPILLLVGVSGAGKDSLKHKLLDTGRYHHIVSHTTRAPRMNGEVLEQDGREYHFISLAEASIMLDQYAFVEAKMYSGNIYGTSVAEIQEAHDTNKIAVTDVEVQGVAEYKGLAPDVKAIFVLPPSYDVWQDRLLSRYGDTIDDTDYAKRMATARVELEKALTSNYFFYLINDQLDEAVGAVEAFMRDNTIDPDAQKRARQVAEELLERLKLQMPAPPVA
ncbi:MAG TPA: hypothetical protein VHD60_03625 [Candidatus Saccharimonadales bacterium]|nr:hypothetical protein [Candidatus Saccharimonadales bacterium]